MQTDSVLACNLEDGDVLVDHDGFTYTVLELVSDYDFMVFKVQDEDGEKEEWSLRPFDDVTILVSLYDSEDDIEI